MNARSIYTTVDAVGITDRRGAMRVITVKTGRNKGRVYPYASARQQGRWAAATNRSPHDSSR